MTCRTRRRLHAIVMAFGCALGGAASGATPAAAQDQPVEEPPLAGQPTLRSPDGSIEILIFAEGPLRYSVRVDGQTVVAPSRLGLRLRDGAVLGASSEIVSVTHQAHDSTWENPFGKRRVVRDHHNQLQLLLRETSADGRTFRVVFRAADDGIAFRYELLSQPGMREFVLEEDLTQFAFPADFTCYAGEQENGFTGPQEWEYPRRRLSDIQAESIVGLPVLIQTPAAWLAIAEADLLDWSGIWIAGAESAANDEPGGDPLNDIEGVDPASPLDLGETADEQNDRPGEVYSQSERAVTLRSRLAPRPDGAGLVQGRTPHRSSWRVLMVGRQPGRLMESELIRNLSTPCALPDISWVKPGMMAWDHWWTGDSVMDTETIKKYIQLAADMGWPYQLIDDGWYHARGREESDITRVTETLDMEEVRRFAAERGVRLWLWLHWTDVERNEAYTKAFPLYQEWGIAGVKIDFMDSDDQQIVQWYEKITRAAAASQLMLNFHGSYKGTGFDRTFPNQLTREGVLGNEYNKWSTRVTPEHKVTLPFTRYLLGPGDFTPGGFLNRQPGEFQFQSPTQVQGTRAAELALLVVYESPIACMCDHPDHYREAAGVDFLKIVPTTWDDTQVISGEVGEHVVVARRRGEEWFLAGLTGSVARELRVKLDFLEEGRWRARLWRDGDGAEEDATRLEVDERSVSAGDFFSVQLAPAGGYVARFTKR